MSEFHMYHRTKVQWCDDKKLEVLGFIFPRENCKINVVLLLNSGKAYVKVSKQHVVPVKNSRSTDRTKSNPLVMYEHSMIMAI